MWKIRCLEPVVAPPIVSRVVAVLGVNVSSKDFPADNRNAQLNTFGHGGLEDDEARA